MEMRKRERKAQNPRLPFASVADRRNGSAVPYLGEQEGDIISVLSFHSASRRRMWIWDRSYGNGARRSLHRERSILCADPEMHGYAFPHAAG